MPAKKGYKKKVPVKKATVRRRPRAVAQPKDGMNLLIASYFQAQYLQSGDGDEGKKLSYTIKCDPKKCTILNHEAVKADHSTPGSYLSNGAGASLIADNATSGDLSFTKWGAFSANFNQYKINSINVQVDVDRECGLDNPVSFVTDKANSNALENMAQVSLQAHKSYTMTETRRSAKYGWKPRDAQDKEWRNMNQDLADNNAHFLKIHQDIEKKANGICKHRIQVIMSVSLKDSKQTLN
jgi:hypothetical protein